MKAELGPRRKNVRCPSCRAELAYRVRLPDGSHVIQVDQWWRPEMVKLADVAVGRARLLRPWSRLEDGRMPTSVASPPEARGRWSRLGLPATLLCRCGEDLELDAATLDVVP